MMNKMMLQMNKTISWNVNGLNSAKKRRQVFHWLSKQNSSIICLQEVHIKGSDVKFLKNKRLGEEFVSLATKKKRGTVIYVRKELCSKKKFADKEGRYIAIEIGIQNKKVLIVNLYAPNEPKTDFKKNTQKN